MQCRTVIPRACTIGTNANLLCLNAYTSKYIFAPGSIQSVRMYTRDGTGNPKLLGTAPVERDGSFFVQVPTEQALQIELLDAAGKTLKREAGFFYMRRGEQRGCVGCHAGPETAPENAVPMILLKSTTPADMTGSGCRAPREDTRREKHFFDSSCPPPCWRKRLRQVPRAPSASKMRRRNRASSSPTASAHGNSGSLLESTGSGCVWFDYNNDGLPDFMW